MAVYKCCVAGCDSTSQKYSLFCMPMNTELRKLWMSFLAPTNPNLLTLSKNQLMRKRVCEKHFDKTQFGHAGVRIRYSYPCLLSKKEILHGMPLSTDEHYIVANEHNYCMFDDQNTNSPETLVVMGKQAEIWDNEHFYCPSEGTVQPETPALIGKEGVFTEHQCEYTSTFPTHQETACCSKPRKEADTLDNEHFHCSMEETVQHQTPISTGKEGVFNENECTSTFPTIQEAACSSNPGEEADTMDNEDVYCSLEETVQPQTPISTGKEGVFTELQCTNTFPTNQEAACSSKPGEKEKSGKENSAKNVMSKTLELSSPERIENTQKCDRNFVPIENFDKLDKKAQKFLLMQLRLARKKKMARRFSLEDKLMALKLMKQSPKQYKLLQDKFALPNKRTLSRLSEKIVFEDGINENILNDLQMATKDWDVGNKLCSIVFDQVALNPDSDIEEKRKATFLDNALVFMIRGLRTPWKQAIAYYFCSGTVTSAKLQKTLKEIIPRLIETGLKPMAIVCNQGSEFRSCFDILKEETLQNTEGMYDGTIHIAGVNLFFFFDPPNLLKGVRNHFLVNDILWNYEIMASWKDIQYIYDADSKSSHTRLLPNLTSENTDPKLINKMEVKAATQVFSARTVTMLHYTHEVYKQFNDSTMKTTAEVVEFFSELFGSVNGSPGSGAKGKYRSAVTPNSPHQEYWQSAIETLKSIRFIDKDSEEALTYGPRYISVPSIDGWITTLESFLRLVKLLFTEYGVDSFYPRFVNLDPLEKFIAQL